MSFTRGTFVLLAAASLTIGCGNRYVEQIAIAGIPHTVTRVGHVDTYGYRDTYKAHRSNPNYAWRTKQRLYIHAYVMNIAAIEAATGCKVDEDTVFNRQIETIASVVC